jgi:hypothetical protein
VNFTIYVANIFPQTVSPTFKIICSCFEREFFYIVGGCPPTLDPHASASQVLGLQACATMQGNFLIFEVRKFWF